MSAGPRRAEPPADEFASSPAPTCFARSYQYDPGNRITAVKLLPGEYHVARSGIVQQTVLGSCVAACIRDVRLGLGGMNHFMLPEQDGSPGANGLARYGAFAMDTLIEHLLRLGARREYLEAKVFGGGSVLSGLTQAKVGERNVAFVLEYLKTERIPVLARDLADIHPRRVHFYPDSGRALVKRLSTQAALPVAERERAYRQALGERRVA